ncbi:hypothetical protein CL622_04055 [archaeon]|nr:hypothetical protein [archaeon]|tara:strand:+ start:903 stop:1106 length:204 start_codon:yes stop_codon:yes gene_type:complete
MIKDKQEEDEKQTTLKESAKDDFYKADISDKTKQLLGTLPTRKKKILNEKDENPFFKKIKEEVANKA